MTNADECLHALKQHHTCHTTGKTYNHDQAVALNDADIQAQAVTLFSGAEVASRFAKSAATHLQPHELSFLTAFFRQTHQSTTNPGLAKEFRERLHEFYSAETRLSGYDRSRLTTPSGDANASLGLILHIQSRDGDAGQFWDPDSATVQMLQGKGLRDDMLFGYDWHWRAESLHDRQNPQCSTRSWPPLLKKLHDDFSMDTLHLLPMPFVILFGSCPRKSFDRLSERSLKVVEVMLTPPDGKLRFLLDFNPADGSLTRLYCLLDHPAALFYEKAALLRKTSSCLDSGLNFMLWLLGVPHEPTYFLRKAALCHYTRWRPSGLERGIKGAPLAELHSYRRKERDEERQLGRHEYSTSFMAWARAYLGQDPDELLNQGLSVASAIQGRINEKISKKAYGRSALKKAGQRGLRHMDGASPLVALAASAVPAPEDESSSDMPFTEEELAWASKWLGDLAQGSSDDMDEENPYAHLTPHQLLTLQYDLAVAEAFYTRRVLNLDPILCAEEREKKVKALKNALRVKEFSIRKAYGVSLRPRVGSKTEVKSLPHIGDATDQHEYAKSQPQGSSSGRALTSWPKPERNRDEIRKKLFEGAAYDCRGAKITIHCGLAIHLPRDASPTGVFMRCHLVSEGNRHRHPLATDALLQDPAVRLGVEVRYTSSENGKTKTKWLRHPGLRTRKEQTH